jgi:hypothetical protein
LFISLNREALISRIRPAGTQDRRETGVTDLNGSRSPAKSLKRNYLRLTVRISYDALNRICDRACRKSNLISIPISDPTDTTVVDTIPRTVTKQEITGRVKRLRIISRIVYVRVRDECHSGSVSRHKNLAPQTCLTATGTARQGLWLSTPQLIAQFILGAVAGAKSNPS